MNESLLKEIETNIISPYGTYKNISVYVNIDVVGKSLSATTKKTESDINISSSSIKINNW